MAKLMSAWRPIAQILRQLGVLSLLIGAAALSSRAFGEPVTTIRNNGDPANRVNMVIVGDGYTAAEMGKYAADAENAIAGFLAQEPYKEYQRYFNVLRVDVISAESGADHPEASPPVSKNTAFDATYNCGNTVRLICVDVSKVNAVLANSGIGSDRQDIVLILVNDPKYGGSGGAVAVASLDPSVIELVLHETGHSFGLLADEYAYDMTPPCGYIQEPPEPNVTAQTNRASIKWNVGGGPPTGWIDLATAIPTLSTDPGVPGLYEGAQYCPSGRFRPTFNSKMRNLGVPFEQVNEEQLIKRIYNLVSPIDSTSPLSSSITVAAGASQSFDVTTPQPDTQLLSTQWYVDNAPVASGSSFQFSSASVTAGTHTVQVVVRDPTSKVRNDPANVLTASRTWTVATTGAARRLVSIDIKPGSFPNTINPRSAGEISVAILSTATFDATTVDPLSVTFGPRQARAVRGPIHLVDVNGDGKKDLLLRFRVQDTGILCGNNSASLGGKTFSGTEVVGSDSIRTVGCVGR